ncbi:hypothetical protein BLA29_000971, partial [Euroglyphus maynei]
DYHDLLTIKSNDSNDGSNHVKFENVNSPSITNDDHKDAHRFIKSPHPRGSIRFAVRRSAQDLDFIDSTIDVKKTLADNLASNEPGQMTDPPNLPPRPSISSTQTTVNDQIPRPKPRISKMAIVNGAVPTSSSQSPSTSSMITSAAQRLAPIPVPEKSTHISQTIQHFANLQRQNNLRRSFAQQQQQQHSLMAVNKSNYADYDYIINNRPKPQDPIAVKQPATMNHCMQTIGNPLYCHVPMPTNSEIHHESSSSSSSSDQDVSLPPSIEPPPPPPTTENLPIVPPKPNRNDQNIQTEAPPTLLPRRPINTSQAPPPIPTTSHPQLSRSNSNQQRQTAQPPPPVCPKPDLIKCLAASKSGGKFLNRSFSDAATSNHGSGSKTLKSRHSLENRPSSIHDYDEKLFDNSQFHRTESQTSFGTDTPTSFDTSPGRSLPTMGVSMLAKKRLSNVSADSAAIEKAINLHHSNNRPSSNTSITSG